MRKSTRGSLRLVRAGLTVAACAFGALTPLAAYADWVSTITAAAPKAWYRFEDTSAADGAAAADSSANALNGQYKSFMQHTTGPGGIGGQAGAFDGIDSYVDTLAANEAQFDFTHDFTFEAWMQVGAFNKTWQAAIAKGDTAWRVARRDVQNSLAFGQYGTTGAGSQWNDTPEHTVNNVNDGRWHHVVGVHDFTDGIGGEVRLYIDGTELIQVTQTPMATNNFPVFIGENSEARGRYWQGAIDEVAIYDRALTAAEVAAHLAAGGGPAQAGSTLPAPQTGAAVTTPAPGNAEGHFGVRIVRAPYTVSGTAGAVAALADPNLKFERYITDTHSQTINFNDPGNAGGGYSIAEPKAPFPGDRGGDDNNIAMQATGKILITEAGDYTFGIDGDDGTRLTVGGANFTFQAGGGAATGDRLEFAGDTGNAFTLGSTFLAAGEHDVQVIWNENGGGAFVELFAAQGIKTALDNTFALVGAQPQHYDGGVIPTVPAGYAITERIRLPEGTQQLNSLADARALLDNPLEADDAEFTGNLATINFNDPEGGGISRIGGDVPFLNDIAADDNDFAMRAEGVLHVETAGTYTFGFSSDDGCALTITGGVFDAITAGGGGVAAIVDAGQTLQFDANSGDTFTLATMTLAPGDYPLEYIMWERGGGASAELFVGAGVRTAFDPTFQLLGTVSFAPDVDIPGGLQLVGPPLVEPTLGDTDGDGDVDLDDLNNVRNNFGATGIGDTDGDNDVDLDDLNNVRNNFGATGGGAVPEPSSFALVGLGLAGLFAARRFRKK